MTGADIDRVLLFVLRQLLFLGPLAMTVFLLTRQSKNERALLGALFSFFYAVPLVFLGHVCAIQLGFWRFEGTMINVYGFPADIWFGGALLWGPCLFLAVPRIGPWLLSIATIALCGATLPVLDPFIEVGDSWFIGVLIVFATAHVPALYLARWTACDTNLDRRTFLLAVTYGVFAFFTLPSLIMHAMGGSWAILWERPAWLLILSALTVSACFVVGLTAVQMFAIHGGGTPIPLDCTKRLVRTGVYAYLRNPMQSCTALSWLALGFALANIWVALSAVMAVLFVQGMVRWHHRQDLEIRFPQGWNEYCANVPEWIPRWRPWVRQTATLSFDPGSKWQNRIVSFHEILNISGLSLRPHDGVAVYSSPEEMRAYRGSLAFVKALEHTNLIGAIVAAAALLIALPSLRILHTFVSGRGLEDD